MQTVCVNLNNLFKDGRSVQGDACVRRAQVELLIIQRHALVNNDIQFLKQLVLIFVSERGISGAML